MRKIRDGREGYELPQTCDTLVDDINWVVATAKAKERERVHKLRGICFFPGDYFKSYHENITHRLIDQMNGFR